MKRVLVDSTEKIIYRGDDAKKVLNILMKEPEEVTEEDEVGFEEQLRNLEWTGALEYQVHFDLKFRGIDHFNRPVFKDVESSLHFGDVHKLWTNEEAKEGKLLKYYRENLDALEFFGESFNCEPYGGRQQFFKFNIID